MPSGIGGHVRIPGTLVVDIRVEEWTLSKAVDSADTTDSGSGGWREREALIKDATGSMNLIFRTGGALEDLSLDIGDQLVLVFLLGTTGLAYQAFIHVKSIRVTNPAKGNDVIKVACEWEHAGGGVLGPATVAAAEMLAEQQFQQLTEQAEAEDAHTERVMQQWQERMEEVQRGQATGERTGQRRAWQRQFERRDLSGKPANGGGVRQPEKVGAQAAPAEQTKGTPGDRPGAARESPRGPDRNPQTPPGQAKP